MKRAGRTVARRRWAQVAEGNLDAPEVREWLASVATAILKADDEPDPDGKERPARIMRAVGLAGRKIDNASMYDTLRELDKFSGDPGGLGGAALRVLATSALRDPSWMTPGAVLGSPEVELRRARLIAAASVLGLDLSLMSTREGRDAIAARIRAAKNSA